MTPLLNKVKSGTQNMICPEHKQKPEYIDLGNKMDFKCCCESFRAQLISESNKIFEAYAPKIVEDALRKAFKGSKNIKFK